jgi:hypothetical protein
VPGFDLLMSLTISRRPAGYLPGAPWLQFQAVVLHLASGCMITVELVQARKYAFKCHRKQEDGKDIVYPVNTMSFHPRHGTFATGGG